MFSTGGVELRDAVLILYRWRAAAREVYQDYRAMRRSVLITTLRHYDAYLLGG